MFIVYPRCLDMGRGFPYNVIKSYIMVAKRYLFLKKWGRMTEGKNMMGTMYDIVVIDSGSNIKNSVGLSVSCVNGVFEIHDGCRDNVGHGTAINYILTQNCTANIFNIGISIPEEEMNADVLIYCLDYYLNQLESKILLICCGLTEYSPKILSLEQKLKKIRDQGVVIIAASSNNDYITYPSSFDFVIGVEESKRIVGFGNDFELCIGGHTNVIMCETFRRIPWGTETRLIKGNSFACAYFATIFFNILKENRTVIDVLNSLKNLAKKTYTIIPAFSPQKNDITSHSKCITFPFNKEMKSLALFNEMCIVDIVDWYDIKLSPYFGKKISSLISESSINKSIKDVFAIDWMGDFDTIILGNVDLLSRIIKKDLKKHIIDNAFKYGKSIYSFECVTSDSRQSIIFPKVVSTDVDLRKQGKLYNITTAVIGIWGTSSKQGKFTLQLKLKRFFEKIGLDVGHISTEPMGYLLGADYVYPMGFRSTVELSKCQAVDVLNSALHRLEVKNKEIIIVGSQSGTIPFSLSTPYNISFEQQELIFATDPAAYVVCVNIWDEIDYIKRTIDYLRVINNSEVLGVAILEDALRDFRSGENNGKYDHIQVEVFKRKINETLNLPVYNISSNKEIENLGYDIINFLR